MFFGHVDISQAFVQGKLLPQDDHNRNVYISSPPGYEEDSRYIYRILKPLCGMPSAARAWHTTMSAILEREGCRIVGFKKMMWRIVIDGHRIVLGAHIDDFVIAFAYPLLAKPNSLLPDKPCKKPFIFVRPSRILATNKIPPLKSMMTIWHV